MSLSVEKLGQLRAKFPCKRCGDLSTSKGCDRCGETGIDWPAAWEDLGKKFELARSAVFVEAADMIEEIADVAARRMKDGR